MNKEEKLAKAIAFAAEKHANQKRKDGTPYIFHPLAVAELLKRYDYDIDYQVAGVLHDVLEDTDATDEEVRAFGEDIYKAVKLVTRPKGADEAEYVKNILTNNMAAVVKNADKIHNMICEDSMKITARSGEYCLYDKKGASWHLFITLFQFFLALQLLKFLYFQQFQSLELPRYLLKVS